MSFFEQYHPKRVSPKTLWEVTKFFAKYADAIGSTKFTINMDDIAQECKLNRSTVVKAIKDMVELGLLVIKGGGGRIPYEYEYKGPQMKAIGQLDLADKLSEAYKLLRLYHNNLQKFYDFVSRIFDIQEHDDYYVLKVYKNAYNHLGIPYNAEEMRKQLRQQFEEINEEILEVLSSLSDEEV